MRPYVIVLLLIFFLPGYFFAQDHVVDSLISRLEKVPNDTDRCMILTQIIESCGDDEKWPPYNAQLKSIAARHLNEGKDNPAELVKYKIYFAEALSNEGYLAQMNDESARALELYHLSLKMQRELDHKRGMVANLNNIGIIYKSRGEISRALKYYLEDLSLQTEINDEEGMAVTLNNIGVIYKDQGDILRALDYYNRSLSVRQKLKDLAGVANSLNNIGLVYQGLGDISNAMTYYYKSLKLWEEAKNKSGIAGSLNNIGLLYSNLGEINKALEYYNKSLSVQKEINDKQGIGTSLNNIAYIYLRKGQLPEAMEYNLQSLKVREEIMDKNGIANSLHNIGSILDKKQNYEDALRYYRKSLAIRQDLGHKEGIAYSLNSIASVLLKMNRINDALQSAKESLKISQELGFPVNISNASLVLSKIWSQTGNYKAALEMYRLHDQMNDSILNETNRKSSLQKSFQYSIEKKEAELKLLKQKSEIDFLKLNEQTNSIKKQRYLLILSMGLIILIILTGYYYFSRQRLLSVIEKEKTIRETEEKERQRMAKDIHDELGSGLSKIKFLSELAYVEVVKQEPAMNHLNTISQTANGLVENMRDLVWAMDPENITLDSLVSRIREYSHDYLEEFPMELETDITENIPTYRISQEIYRNVFMIVKETLQNVVKHANASKVHLTINLDRGFRLEIQDNGKGFQSETPNGGNGLKNIKNRSQLIGAKLSLASASNNGFSLKLELPDLKSN